VINRREETDQLVRSLAHQGRVRFSEVTVNEIRESLKPRVAFGNFAYAYANYMDELGLHRPKMDGPNRSMATLVDRDVVEAFHRELQRKLELQRGRRYRFLFWRKATRELGRYLSPYWDWFSHRVLRAGRDRTMRPDKVLESMKDFR
jgi:hypothetical protein